MKSWPFPLEKGTPVRVRSKDGFEVGAIHAWTVRRCYNIRFGQALRYDIPPGQVHPLDLQNADDLEEYLNG